MHLHFMMDIGPQVCCDIAMQVDYTVGKILFSFNVRIIMRCMYSICIPCINTVVGVLRNYNFIYLWCPLCVLSTQVVVLKSQKFVFVLTKCHFGTGTRYINS